MNNRFKELVEQASSGACYDEPGAVTLYNDEIKKFAELIVRECCGILTENVEVALDASGSPVYPEGLIYEHFGVEE